MVSIKAEFDISLHFRKYKGQRVDYKGTTNANPVSKHSNKSIRSLTERRTTLFLKPKDDRTYGERVDDRLEAGYRELKRFRKDAVKIVETTVQLGA